MGLIAAKCPQCGGEVTNDGNREFMFCTFCGSKVMFEKKIVELQGTVSVDGIASVKSMADRANILLANREFQRAGEYFDKILDVNPHFSRAYWGLLMCKIGANSNDELICKALSVNLTDYPEYANAMKFANDEETAMYQLVTKKIIEEIKRQQEEEKKAAEEKAEVSTLLQKLNFKNYILAIGITVDIVLALVSIIFLTGKLSFFPVVFLLISLVALVFLIKKFISNDKIEKELKKKLK